MARVGIPGEKVINSIIGIVPGFSLGYVFKGSVDRIHRFPIGIYKGDHTFPVGG